MKGYRDADKRYIITNVAWKRKRNRFSILNFLKNSSLYLYFALSVIWLELMFHIRFFGGMNVEFIHAVLFSVCLAMIPASICSVLPKKAAKIMAIVFSAFIFLLFAVQAVYYEVFKTFLILFSVGAGTGQVLEFWKIILEAIKTQGPTLLLYSFPLLFLCIVGLRQRWQIIRFGRLNIWHTVAAVFSTIILHIILLATLRVYGTDLNTPYYLYNEEFIPNISMEKLGLMTTMRLDLKNFLFGADEGSLVLENITTTTPENTTPHVVINFPSDDNNDKDNDVEAMLNYVIDTSPNIIDIDFVKLGAEAQNADVATLHNYFASRVPTDKNEYTGMFEGYNLIKITAEAYSPAAVNEELTPTLYKLTNSGFVFTNYYTPSWWVSTLDGEFPLCTGLIPRSDRWAFGCIGRDNVSMPFSLGNMMTSIGYSTYAYHNHTYTYYDRHLSHPKMGYIYKGLGNGLEVRATWPESDVEMMELTISEYVDKVPFHVYYLTVSGHMNYNFMGNFIAYKHRKAVEHLDYSEAARAYLACQIELDKAMEKLIDELDKAGLLETTVIVISADHWPYGLDIESYNELLGYEVDETFGIYESPLTIWSGSMKEPIVIDKPCSSIDVMPTLCNLFGLEYDSRLYMGKDILSDAAPLVVFNDRSFITDKIMYNASAGKNKEKITYLTEEELPDNYVSDMISTVNNMFKVSKAILDTDYYSYIEEYTTYGIDKAMYPEKYNFSAESTE